MNCAWIYAEIYLPTRWFRLITCVGYAVGMPSADNMEGVASLRYQPDMPVFADSAIKFE